MQEMNPSQFTSIISPEPFVAHGRQLPAHFQDSGKTEEKMIVATPVPSQTLPRASSPPRRGQCASTIGGTTDSECEDNTRATTSDVSKLLLRKFSSLNRRVLFHLQEEITCLETELRELGQLLGQAEADESRMETNVQNINQLRWRYNELLATANWKLGEYRQCSYREEEVSNFLRLTH